MSAYSDKALGRILKNWAAEHQPPADGRAQLLSQAAVVQRKKFGLTFIIPRPQFNDYPMHSTGEWSQTLFSYFFAQSIHANLQARF
jgi:hypothetical protein